MSPVMLGGGVEVQAGYAIDDDFGSDTSANYTSIVNGITITSGAVYGSTNWADNLVYHETALSSDHWVQAVCENATVGPIIGYDSSGNDGYAVYISGGYTQVRYLTDGAVGNDACTDSNASAESMPYTIKVNWNGSNDMDVWVNGTQYVTNCNPSTDYNGTFVGLCIRRGSGANYYMDDLTADDN